MDDPKQISGEELTKTRILTGSMDLFNINILPERYHPKRLRLVAVLPWLLLILLLASLYPSVIMALEAKNSFNQINSEMVQIQASMEVYQSASDEADRFVSEIEAAKMHRDQILDSYQGIDLPGTNWNDSLFEIEEITPSGISWIQISQEENEIHLDGIAITYQIVLDLVDSLTSMDTAKSVQIETIDQIVEEEIVFIPPEGGEEILPVPTSLPSYSFTILVLTTGESQP